MERKFISLITYKIDLICFFNIYIGFIQSKQWTNKCWPYYVVLQSKFELNRK